MTLNLNNDNLKKTNLGGINMTPFREVAALAMYEWNYKYSMGEGEAARQKAREDAEKIKQLDDPAKLIIASLFQIHDGWVDSHEAKFSQPGRNKQFQHMPTELIGLSQTKLDLVFLKPILAASGIEIDDATLEAAYNDAVMKFLAKNDIKSTEDLIAKIQQGAQFYPALEGQDSITTQLADPEFVRTVIIPQIEKNGIGKIEDFIAAHQMVVTPGDVGDATKGVSGKEKSEADEAMGQALNVGLKEPTTDEYDDGPSA